MRLTDCLFGTNHSFICIDEACGVAANEKWAVREGTAKKGFSSKSKYIVESEAVVLRMESFGRRCRQAISVAIGRLKTALQYVSTCCMHFCGT